MARINNTNKYNYDTNLSGDDFLIGSDAEDNKKTKNYKITDLVNFIKDNVPAVDGEFVKKIDYDEIKLELTIHYNISEHQVINLPKDNFLANIDYNVETKILTFTLTNNSTFSISLSELVDVYTVADNGGLELVNFNEFKIKDSEKLKFEKNVYDNDGVLSTARTIDTGGKPLYIKGLPNKTLDNSFNLFVVQDNNGQCTLSTGYSLLKNLPNILTPAEKDTWFAKMNSQVSFTGTSIRAIIPPIISREDKHKNFVIKGLGLNILPQNSYIGLILPDSTEMEATNKVVVGDAQTIIGEFMIDNSKPLGDYKVKVINSGIPAIGDVYLKVVNSIEMLPITGQEVRTLNNVVTPDNSWVANTFTLSPNALIKPLADETVTISQYLTGDILKGNEDWWLNVNITIKMQSAEQWAKSLGYIGLTDDNTTEGIINAAIVSHAILKHYNSNISVGGILGNSNNIQSATVDYVKIGSNLTVIISVGANTITTSLPINTYENYRFFLSKNNTAKPEDEISGTVHLYKTK